MHETLRKISLPTNLGKRMEKLRLLTRLAEKLLLARSHEFEVIVEGIERGDVGDREKSAFLRRHLDKVSDAFGELCELHSICSRSSNPAAYLKFLGNEGTYQSLLRENAKDFICRETLELKALLWEDVVMGERIAAIHEEGYGGEHEIPCHAAPAAN